MTVSVFCLTEDTPASLVNNLLDRVVGGARACSRPPAAKSGCGGEGVLAAGAGDGGAGGGGTGGDWPMITYLKRQGAKRVTRFDVFVGSEVERSVENCLKGVCFDEAVGEGEGARRWNAVRRYLCFCGGDIKKAQTPASVRAYVRKLEDLAKPENVGDGNQPMSPKTLANEVTALRGAICAIQTSDEDDSENWRHWNSTVTALKVGMKKRGRAALKAQCVARTATFNSLPSLPEAVKAVDEKASVTVLKECLCRSSSHSADWNEAIGCVISHLYSRANFSRPQALRSVTRKDLVKLLDGGVYHDGNLKNFSTFGGGQTARLADGDHMSRKVIDAFVEHVPADYDGPVFHLFNKRGVALQRPQDHMTKICGLSATKWRKIFELHVEDLHENGVISGETRERCALSQDHNVDIARTIYANRGPERGRGSGHVQSYVRAERNAEVAAAVLHGVTSGVVRGEKAGVVGPGRGGSEYEQWQEDDEEQQWAEDDENWPEDDEQLLSPLSCGPELGGGGGGLSSVVGRKKARVIESSSESESGSEDDLPISSFSFGGRARVIESSSESESDSEDDLPISSFMVGGRGVKG